MTFKVFLHRKTAKFLEDMNPRVRERVKEGLGSLEDFHAFKLDLVKVSGESDVYRGSFRQVQSTLQSLRERKDYRDCENRP
jgi:mRNA-degrading endonuclease RelE of RelBE toxin-antitoxin system